MLSNASKHLHAVTRSVHSKETTKLWDMQSEFVTPGRRLTAPYLAT